MTAVIGLTKGKQALVTKEDLSKLSNHSWHVTSHGYAAAMINGKITYMHRYIMNAPKGKQVDHIDRDKLNNTRTNLRLVTETQNKQNMAAKGRNTSSKYKGVYFDKSRKKWMAMIMFDGNRKHLGRFENEIDAAKAYNEASKKYHGEYGYLNEVKESEEE